MTGSEANASAAPKTSWASRAREWLWRGQALRVARAYRRALPPEERRAIDRALVAAERAERAYDPVDALRSGSSLPLSVSLFREAAFWALRAHDSGLSGSTLEALFDGSSRELLTQAAGGSEPLSRARRALVERSFVDTAELPPELLPGDAEAARTFVQGLVRAKLQPERRAEQLLVERTVRLLALLAVLAAIVSTALWAVGRHRRPEDLAAGKPWRASSSPDICHPEIHRCAGVRTDMFFTTSEESEPWVQIDLGKTTGFNTVDVTNRSDCCPDRAVPLVIEVSRDGTHFREVARREQTFSFWAATFARQRARYVRLRVPRRTILHLDRVAVHDVK